MNLHWRVGWLENRTNSVQTVKENSTGCTLRELESAATKAADHFITIVAAIATSVTIWFAVSFVYQLYTGDGDASVPTSVVAPAVSASAASSDPPSDVTAQAVDMILMRPLFEPGRRPSTSAVTKILASLLPRLNGVVITPVNRLAIFSASSGTKSVIAREGNSLGGFVVRSIEGDRVLLIGPEGSFELKPTFEEIPRDPSRPLPLFRGAGPPAARMMNLGSRK